MSAKFNKMITRGISIFVLLVMLLSLVPTSAKAQSQASYIVQGNNIDLVAQQVEQFGGTITTRLPLIHAVAADLSLAAVNALQNAEGIQTITPNNPVESSNETTAKVKNPPTDYAEVSGANYVWEQGITGAGVTIAVVDSGLENYSSLVKNASGQNRLLAWVDMVQGKNKPTDPNGHGTHITGIMVNSEKGTDNAFNGIAPDANLVSVRVLDKEGRGTYESVIAGIQWVVDHKDEYNIRVMNLSLTGEVLSPYWADPLNMAVTAAWANGIVVVTCAGNNGPDPMTISVPGNNPYAITVGAFSDAYTPTNWEDDTLASFSAAGPTADAFIKPDLLAPGTHMVSIMPNGSFISTQHDANWIQSTRYYEMAGTSQAAAVVTGVVALMLEQNPVLSPDEVKYRLTASAMPYIEGGVPAEEARALYSAFQQGAGRINAPDAVFADSLQGSANQGMNIWADLSGEEHYQGYAYYDAESGVYGVSGSDPALDDGYSVWDGGLGLWSGGLGIWSGGLGIWSGGLGLWSGGLGIWSGGLGIWSGGLGIWSGGLGIWSGGLGIWSGGLGIWSGTYFGEETNTSSMQSMQANGAADEQAAQFDFSDAQLQVEPWVEE